MNEPKYQEMGFLLPRITTFRKLKCPDPFSSPAEVSKNSRGYTSPFTHGK